MQKDPIEAMCRQTGLAPSRRETIQGRDVFVADGFALLPHVTFRRFGVDANDFPTVCHATIWWAARGEDKFDVGAPMFFEPHHNPEYDHKTKRQARINTALNQAAGFLHSIDKARGDNAKPI